jgi:S1-C subfamily serine protease
MNLNDLSTQLLYTTVPIWVERQDGGRTSGTAFIYTYPSKENPNQTIPLVITNHHIVQGAKRVLLEFVEREGEAPGRGKRLRVEADGKFFLQNADVTNDLAALPIASILTQLSDHGKQIFYRSITPNLIPDRNTLDSLAAIEEITFIGYPSGLYDEVNLTPIVRRGITATPPWNDFQGKPSFLIDAGVFPGSSGSPVFILNQGSYATNQGIVIGSRVLFLGILSESIVRTETVTQRVFLGIGRVIRSERVKSYVEELVARLTRKGPQK